MIAVAGGKGGCGKTTTAACLARALADAGSKSLCVDADVDMPNLHILAGADPEPGLDALVSGEQVSAVTQSSLELPGVRLIPSGTISTADVASALKQLTDREHPVIVDTAAGASSAVTDPIRLADTTILVSTPGVQSLEDAAKTMAMSRALDTPVAGVVLTRSDGSVDPSPLIDCPVLAHVPAVEKPVRDERVRAVFARIAGPLCERNI